MPLSSVRVNTNMLLSSQYTVPSTMHLPERCSLKKALQISSDARRNSYSPALQRIGLATLPLRTDRRVNESSLWCASRSTRTWGCGHSGTSCVDNPLHLNRSALLVHPHHLVHLVASLHLAPIQRPNNENKLCQSKSQDKKSAPSYLSQSHDSCRYCSLI